MNRLLSAASLLVILYSCKKDENKTKPPDPVAQVSAPKAEAPKTIKWYHESYEEALAVAKKADLPLLVDLWAPWCHACMYMKKEVLVDAVVGERAQAFVWLALDREKQENAALMVKFPVPVSPAYYIVDPRDEQILARRQGATSGPIFNEFLDSARRSFADSRDKGSLEAPERLYREGLRSAARQDYKTADQKYEEARRLAPKAWPELPGLLIAQVTGRFLDKNYKGCAELAAQSITLASSDPAAVGAIAYEADKCAQKTDKELSAKVHQAIIEAVDASLASHETAIIERAEAMQMKRYSLFELGEEDAAYETAEAERAMLDKGASEAKSPRDSLPFWILSAEVYVFLEEQQELIPRLEAATKALPDYYYLKFLLAQLYFVDGQHEAALAEANRAIALAYGPQKANILHFVTQVHAAREDDAALDKARDTVVEYLESLPPGHLKPEELEHARKEASSL